LKDFNAGAGGTSRVVEKTPVKMISRMKKSADDIADDHDVFKHLTDKLDQNRIKQRVRGAIIEILPSGGISNKMVAQKLNISTRTLQRKLQATETTFKTLVDEVRQELAEHYIQDPTISLMEIAFILGYSEYSSFSRAYKNWKGTSPNEMRKQERNFYLET
jgi:AraC-like DNA-binding protein